MPVSVSGDCYVQGSAHAAIRPIAEHTRLPWVCGPVSIAVQPECGRPCIFLFNSCSGRSTELHSRGATDFKNSGPDVGGPGAFLLLVYALVAKSLRDGVHCPAGKDNLVLSKA